MKKSKKALIWLAILGAWLIWSPSFSQNKENVKNNAKKELVNIYWKNIAHETIIEMDADDILKIYGKEAWLEIINENFLIEINKLREEYELEDLQISNDIKHSSQEQSEYLDKLWEIEHMIWDNILWKRLENDDIKFYICWENLAKGQHDIKKLMKDRLRSEWHKANMIEKRFKKIWLWYKNWIRVLIFIG